jgi:hypothetical protein
LRGDLVFDENGGAAMKQKKPKRKAPSAQPVDSAVPVLRKPKESDAEKVSVTRGVASVMKAHALWGSSKELRDAGTKWIDAADAIEANAARIAAMQRKLGALQDVQRELRRDWDVSTYVVLATVRVVCTKSKDLVQALGFDVRTQTRAPRAAPAGLVSMPGKRRGEATFTWTRPNDRHDYVVQRALEPEDPSTYSAIVPCSKKTYTLKGEVPESVVYLRVAARDPHVPEGQGPWSDWIACTVAS